MLFADGNALEHVLDTYEWHFVEAWHWKLPLPYVSIGAHKYGISKYTILMALVAGLILWIYLPLAKKIQSGAAPTGIFWNLFEAVLTFIRDNIAKPYIGKEADRYVPFLWTLFLFVLFCNLFGMIPFLGSPTASITVTAVLAAFVFGFIHYNSVQRFGWKAHLKSFAPALDMPFAMKLGIWLMLWPIEFLGLIVKCFVLAVRLFANMFAGHIVLGTLLLFIPMVKNASLATAGTVTFASALGVFALSFLELFVAFLQAFLFVFLTALFFGGVLEHAEHAAHAGDHDHGHAEDEQAATKHAHAPSGHGH